MKRRNFLAGSLSGLPAPPLTRGSAAPSGPNKIRRIRAYLPPKHIDPDVLFLSIAIIETDQGIRQAVMALGFRCFGTFVSQRYERLACRGPACETAPGFDGKKLIYATYENRRDIREAVGPGAKSCVDYHTRLDPSRRLPRAFQHGRQAPAISFRLEDEMLRGGWAARDLRFGRDLPDVRTQLTAELGAHDAALCLLTKKETSR